MTGSNHGLTEVKPSVYLKDRGITSNSFQNNFCWPKYEPGTYRNSKSIPFKGSQCQKAPSLVGCLYASYFAILWSYVSMNLSTSAITALNNITKLFTVILPWTQELYHQKMLLGFFKNNYCNNNSLVKYKFIYFIHIKI